MSAYTIVMIRHGESEWNKVSSVTRTASLVELLILPVLWSGIIYSGLGYEFRIWFLPMLL